MEMGRLEDVCGEFHEFVIRRQWRRFRNVVLRGGGERIDAGLVIFFRVST
jgi:hypothetical protein